MNLKKPQHQMWTLEKIQQEYYKLNVENNILRMRNIELELQNRLSKKFIDALNEMMEQK